MRRAGHQLPAAALVAAFALFAGAFPMPTAASTDAPDSADIAVDPSEASVFFHGEAPRDTVRIVAAIEGPRLKNLRAASLRRIAGLWLPGRSYSLTAVPSFYQVSASCPSCNGLAHCEHRLDVTRLNRLLASHGAAIGLAWFRQSTAVVGSSQSKQADQVLDELWRRGVADGRYRIRENAIRINSRAVYYHLLQLPDLALEGRYEVVTWFLATDRVVDVRRDWFELRRTGAAAWLGRQAARRNWEYAVATVLLIAVAGLLSAGRRPPRSRET